LLEWLVLQGEINKSSFNNNTRTFLKHGVKNLTLNKQKLILKTKARPRTFFEDHRLFKIKTESQSLASH